MAPYLTPDVVYGLRRLARRPVFSVGVVLLLALALGGYLAVFTAVDTVLLKGLPYPRAEQLAFIAERRPMSTTFEPVAPRNYYEWVEASRSFGQLAAYASAAPVVVVAKEPQLLRMAYATASLFELLGRRPVLGRPIGSSDERPGLDRARLSDECWRRSFGARGVIGRRIELDGKFYTIEGIISSDLPAVINTDVWRPLKAVGLDPDTRVLWVIGRLAPRMSMDQARAEMDAIVARLKTAYPDLNAAYGEISVQPLHDRLVGDSRVKLQALLASAVFFLLIACSAVVTLQLIRTEERRHELAVQLALGASWRRLFGQLTIECTMLALLGGVLGIFVAAGLLRVLTDVYVLLPNATDLSVNVRIAAVALTVCLVIGVLTAAIPLARIGDVHASLRQGTAAAGLRTGRRRTFSLLILTETALATTLLGAALLVSRSLVKLQSIDLGFTTKDVYVVGLKVPLTSSTESGDSRALYASIIDQLGVTPGITAVGIIDSLPFGGTTNSTSVHVANGTEAVADGVQLRLATAGYFRALGIPLRAGRLFLAKEHHPVVVVNERRARRLGSVVDPLSARVTLKLTGAVQFEVVGLVGDTRDIALAQEAVPTVYMAANQVATTSEMSLVVRTPVDKSTVRTLVRAVVSRNARNVAVSSFSGMDDLVARGMTRERALLILLGVFAAMAVVLAAAGVYATVAYVGRRRAHEFAVRAALGADRGQLLVAALRSASVMGVMGVGVGAAGAILCGTAMSQFLYGVAGTDAIAVAGGSLLLATVVIVAAYLPARHVVGIAPGAVLRHD